MRSGTELTDAPTTSREPAHFTFWSLGAAAYEPSSDGHLDGETSVRPVPVQERIRKIPEALALTAGYYASRVPALSGLLHRED